MKCPSCRTRELVVINMKVADERISLRTCSSCDLRYWEGLDGQLPLDSVLALVGRR
jgi:transcriptional regulator NrdR family protein